MVQEPGEVLSFSFLVGEILISVASGNDLDYLIAGGDRPISAWPPMLLPEADSTCLFCLMDLLIPFSTFLYLSRPLSSCSLYLLFLFLVCICTGVFLDVLGRGCGRVRSSVLVTRAPRSLVVLPTTTPCDCLLWSSIVHLYAYKPRAKMLSSLCCCIPGLSSSKTSGDAEPRPEMAQSTPRSVTDTDTTYSYSYGTNRTNRTTRTNSTHTTYRTDNQDTVEHNGYASVVSLPRYTPRPVSLREKTVDAHLRSSRPPSLSSRGSDSMDEKQQLEYDPEGGVVADDGSSAFSFQSSYGNTSTATRETPPPPYSPRMSRSMSSSISSQRAMPVPVPLHMQMQPIAQPIAQPRPVYQRPEWIGRTSPRSSEEGSRNE